MNLRLLTENHLECLSWKGGCTGSSESTLVKMLISWKSHVEAHIPKPPVVSTTFKSVIGSLLFLSPFMCGCVCVLVLVLLFRSLFSFLILQWSHWGRENWMLCSNCIFLLCWFVFPCVLVSLPHGSMGWSFCNYYAISRKARRVWVAHCRFKQTLGQRTIKLM